MCVCVRVCIYNVCVCVCLTNFDSTSKNCIILILLLALQNSFILAALLSHFRLCFPRFWFTLVFVIFVWLYFYCNNGAASCEKKRREAEVGHVFFCK
eukprot:m.36137 g.36137  ORF g.36137 m.36137 type:complete len:97 (-) comp10077_c0_seq1:1227-1517(-)